MKVVALVAMFILSLLGVSLTWPETPSAPGEVPRRPVEAPIVQNPGNPPDVLAAVVLSQEAYYARVQAEIDAYFIADHERVVAEERDARRAAVAGAQGAGVTAGACTGFAIPDYIILRESGGNPSAYNPSGAYGCAQTLLSHYSGGTCAGLDPYTIDGQRECVWRLSSGGTNLTPWAATR